MFKRIGLFYSQYISWKFTSKAIIMKKINKTLFFPFVFSCILAAFPSCGSKENINIPPALTTTNVSDITGNSAKSGGIITSDGGSNVTARGVCWSTSANPTTLDNKTMDGIGAGTFTSSVSGLISGTTYNVRAYAVNSTGTGYGNVYQFTTTGPVTDIDGNTYETVTIGTQTWMVGNLKTTKFRTGESISNVKDSSAWRIATFSAWCDYNNDTANGALYGKLYNWAAINDARNITPVGWHIASHAEWTTLVNFLGGESTAGAKLKEVGVVHWKTPNTGATNNTGFTALPGGKRDPSGAFGSLGDNGYWWTSTENSTTAASVWFWYMSFDNTTVHKDYDSKMYGRSVRCVKDTN